MHPSVDRSTIYNSTWKQPKCPWTDEWVKKMWHLHTRGYYSVIKKNEIMPFATTWMDLEIIIQSEKSQTEKDKCHMISFICRILKKKVQMNLFTNQKQTHRHREQIYGYQTGKVGGGIN